MENKKLEEIINKFNEYKEDLYQLEKAKIYKTEREDFVNEYGPERLLSLNLKNYTALVEESRKTMLYNIEYGKYAPLTNRSKSNKEEKYFTSKNEYISIANPKITGYYDGLKKSLIYADKKTKKYKLDDMIIEDDEAQEVWKKIRTLMVQFLKNLDEIENYKEINYDKYFSKESLNETLGKNYFNNNPHWTFKIFLLYLATQYYPNKFIGIGVADEINKAISELNISIEGDCNIIQKSFAVNKYLRENIEEANEYDANLLFEAVKNTLGLFTRDQENEENNKVLEQDDENEGKGNIEKTIQYGFNTIFYGAPGCGKSFEVNKIVNDKNNNFSYSDRILFHPDYSYSDFIGQVIPKVINEEKVIYTFEPGPFSKILKKALKNKDKKYCLIIEEINRGNAAAIFGDIFQLLDRRNTNEKNVDGMRKGDSEYQVVNYQLSEYLAKEDKEQNIKQDEIKLEKVYIPNNLYIYATMNTCDQNVFTLDTAFKRRWYFEKISNKFNYDEESDKKQSEKEIVGLGITWGTFQNKINEVLAAKLKEYGIDGEDKQLGKYFVTDDDLNSKNNFAKKVLLYLWQDAVKINTTILFDKNYTTLDQLIDDFIGNKGIEIFNEEVFEEDINSREDIGDWDVKE